MYVLDTFRLLSVELDPMGGLSASYTIAPADEVVEFKAKSIVMVHPDLRDLFEQLRERVTFLLGFPAEAAEVIYCKGVTYPGDGKVIFHARIVGPEGDYKVKTPKVRILKDEEALFESINKEVYAYLFEHKNAELSIFGSE
ncbi:MAG: hypothetical protein J6T35_01425 [Bacteroidales bacterium]|nr:hypothetical protein [Bacteroidales bacterium]